MSEREPDRTSRPDDENPEWTAADFAKARPALEVFETAFGRDAADTLRRSDDRETGPTLRLDPDVLDAYRREGQGWEARMNQILRTHMPDRRE